MKKITFVNNPSYQEQHELHRWFYRSLIALASTTIILAALSIKDKIQLQKLMQEQQELSYVHEQFEACMTQKRELKENQELLHKKVDKINHLRAKTSQAADLLQNINKALGQQVTITSLYFKKKELKLNVLAPNTQTILNLTEQLKNQKPFTQISLQSIEPSDKETKAYIELQLG